VAIGRRAHRWIRGMRVEVVPLDAHFVGRVRTTLFGEAVARSRRSILSTLDLAVSIRVSAGTQVAVESNEAVREWFWVAGAAEVVKNGSFGGHGRGFVGCHLIIGSSDRGVHLR